MFRRTEKKDEDPNSRDEEAIRDYVERDDNNLFSCRRAVFLGSVSALLLIVFAFSAIVQRNDPDKFEWTLFYGLHAVISCLALLSFRCSSFAMLEKSIYVLAAGMTVWSCINIALQSVKVAKEEEDAELREEYAYELGGASLGAFSALYHACVVRFCIPKQ